MNLNVKIFTEGGEKIGFGHISRCTALYDEVSRQGIPVELFILNNGSEDNESSLLESRKVSFVNWQNPDYLLKNLDKQDLCIVDSYLAPIEIYELIAGLVKKAVYLDDYGRLDYPQGIVVNPSLSTEGIEYKPKQNVDYLLGEQYIILRTPFLGKKKRSSNKRIQQVLITLGGADPLNMTERITGLLSKEYPELVFNVVFGKWSQLTDQLNHLENVKTHYNLTGQEMCDLMLRTDFAISAAGQTIHELVYLQIPFMAIQTVKNQDNNVDALKRIMLNLRIIDYNDPDMLKIIDENLSEILLSTKSIEFFNSTNRFVDGVGCKRIIERLVHTASEFFIREATLSDSELLFHWVNEKSVRDNAFNSESISYNDHFSWIKKQLNACCTKMYIAYIDETAIGQIRVEFNETGDGEIDYSIDPKFRGMGYGAILLLELVDMFMKEEKPSYKRLIGKVKFKNTPSRKAFQKAKFDETRMADYVYYIYELKAGKSKKERI